CVLVEAETAQATEHVHISDCRFEGPARAGVTVAGPANDVIVQRNRIFQTGAGMVFPKAEPPAAVRMVVLSNTFHSVPVGLRFDGALSVANSDLAVKNNLFVKTGRLSHVADFEPSPETKAHWIWSDEGTTGRTAPAEPRYFRRSFDGPDKAG